MKPVTPAFSAQCTWGDGPDVLVVLKDWRADPYPLMVFPDRGASFGMTGDEARALAMDLVRSADRADELREGVS